jgi:hypothetical protein
MTRGNAGTIGRDRYESIAALASLVVLILVTTSCTTFGTPRSAVVTSGHAVTGTASLSSPPNDDIAWLWGLYCRTDCSRPIPAVALDYTFGVAPDSGAAFEVGGGVNGVHPFLHGYVQAGRDRQRPWGAGVRIGAPFIHDRKLLRHEHQAFVRMDVRRRDDRALLISPTLYFVEERSGDQRVSGRDRRRLLTVVPAVGWETSTPQRRITYGVSPVLGWLSFDDGLGTSHSRFDFFAVLSVGVTFHRPTR